MSSRQTAEDYFEANKDRYTEFIRLAVMSAWIDGGMAVIGTKPPGATGVDSLCKEDETSSRVTEANEPPT